MFSPPARLLLPAALLTAALLPPGPGARGAAAQALPSAVTPADSGRTGSAPSGAIPGWAEPTPVLGSLVEFGREQSDLRVALERYSEDRKAIFRRYSLNHSPVQRQRIQQFYDAWDQRLHELDFKSLNHEGQIDYILLGHRLEFERKMLEVDDKRWSEMAPLVPFADVIRVLQEARHDRKDVDARGSAEILDGMAQEVERLTAALVEEGQREADGVVSRPGITPVVAFRAAGHVDHLRSVLTDWNRFYTGYDPLFTWWTRVPYERLDKALGAYKDAIRRHAVGIRPGEPDPIVGDPVLAEGLRAHLAVEMIPYDAEELIAIGWKEFDWIEEQLRQVSNKMGYGDDWHAALEHVKNLAPPPGEVPRAILDIAEYSRIFIEGMDAITLPPLAEEIWRLEMQSPERQLINPFFTGGEVTRLSYPTEGMTHADKMMSMRGNTPSFNFPTVQHELIPGHHLQGFMTGRFNSHRGDVMRTPFWGEGWALYWELVLWDEGFPRSPEDEIGMLFWRMHRAARIVFSLNYQLGNWTPEEAVNFLVERVGHERANAEAEVRRSAQAPPLYQMAYLIGGLQFQALYDEFVESGRMSAREFHDSVMLGGRMPVELVRARLAKQPLSPDFTTTWRFSGEPGRSQTQRR